MDLGFFGIIDVVIVLSVILFAVIGWKKGFLLKIVEMASSIFGLIASIILARPFSAVLDGWFGETIDGKIHEYLISRPLFSAELTEINVRAAFAEMSLPEYLIDWIVKGIDFQELGLSIVDAIQPLIKGLVLLVLAFVVLFIGSIIVFFFLKILAKLVTKLPVIKQIDKVLGVLFGLLKITVLVYILMFLLALVITVPAIHEAIGGFLATDMQLGAEEFRLSKWIYENNVLRHIIGVFF